MIFQWANSFAIFLKIFDLIFQFHDDNWVFLFQLIDFFLCNFNVVAKIGSIAFWECLYFINCFVEGINFNLFCFIDVLFDQSVNEYKLIISKLISIILILEYCSIFLNELSFCHRLSILSLLPRARVLTEFSEAKKAVFQETLSKDSYKELYCLLQLFVEARFLGIESDQECVDKSDSFQTLYNACNVLCVSHLWISKAWSVKYNARQFLLLAIISKVSSESLHWGSFWVCSSWRNEKIFSAA